MSSPTTKQPKEMTAHWPSRARTIVVRNIPNACTCVAMGESNDGGYTASNQLPPSEQVVVSYNYKKEVFILWNGAVHHHIHSRNSKTTLSMGADVNRRLEKPFDEDSIEEFYKEIKRTGVKKCVEKVLIVGKSALLEFCQHYDEYLIPNIDNIPEGKKCLYARANGKLQEIDRIDEMLPKSFREIDVAVRARRSPKFRSEVLKQWGNRCIVCGATEVKILEAAHMESVKDGGSDDPHNGYCLCANHHKMYDAALLDIDLKSKSFRCNSEAAKAMPWYKAAEQRDFKLYFPNEEKEKHHG